MALKVLIVDDSGFFRRRLKELLESGTEFTVVGTASNGREAIDKTRELKPDVITMDYEMPIMDGITAVRNIMASTPTPILMFSSLTYEGARVTLDALDAGAVDFLPKNFEEIANSSAALKKRLFECLHSVARAGGRRHHAAAPAPEARHVDSRHEEAVRAAIKPEKADVAKTISARPEAARAAAQPVQQSAQQRAPTPAPVPAPKPVVQPPPVRAAKRTKPYGLLAIGTSTGGPVALQKILTRLPANFRVPIVLVQHMPATFTPAFAERLNTQCQIKVKEAVDGDTLQAGVALLAPGGKQLMISRRGMVKVLPGDERLNYKPCVDVTFGSAANAYADQVLALVLTGMGADGRDGARLLKQAGSSVWAQDEATSTIYGMPMAIARAGLADEVLALDDIAKRLLEVV
jgi:two-component system chemotaxis response regulator CheB